MNILRELQSLGFNLSLNKPKILCKVFEDNSSTLEMATNHKFCPHTKHINVKLHHFRNYVLHSDIAIHAINTKDQLADYLTKPVNDSTLVRL